MKPVVVIEPLWAIQLEYASKFFDALASVNIPEHAYSYNRDTDAFQLDYTVKNGVAIIDMKGPLSRETSWMTRWYGGTGADLLSDCIDRAAMDQTVSNAILNTNSPGGVTTAVEPIVAAIHRFRDSGKKIKQFSDSMCCSAAYGIGSHCNGMVSTKGAIWGSIGTLLVVHDSSKLYANAGIKVIPVASGKFKGTAVPGTPVTQEQVAKLQEYVDAINQVFIDLIAEGRGMSVDAVMELATGESWVGSDAKAKGLVDEIMSFDKLLASMSTNQNGTQSSSQRSTRGGYYMSNELMEKLENVLSEHGIVSKNQAAPPKPNAAANNPLLQKLTSLGITEVTQLDTVLSNATLGVEYRQTLIEQATQQANRLYSDKGPAIAKSLEFASVEHIKAAISSWTAEADLKYGTNPNTPANRVSAATSAVLPVAQGAEDDTDDDAEFRKLMNMTSVGQQILAKGGK